MEVQPIRNISLCKCTGTVGQKLQESIVRSVEEQIGHGGRFPSTMVLLRRQRTPAR